jgi:hypothetical protein
MFVYNIILLNFLNSIKCNEAVAYQMGFKDPATPMFEGTVYLHDLI